MKSKINPSDFRILVVDDKHEVLTATVRLLAKAGYTVDSAASGEAAVASALEHRPNLVLLDRDMPGMDGMEVCRRIRTNPALAGLFVIFVSGVNVASEEQVEGLESGADGYIIRPIANRELLARVDAYVRILSLNRSLQNHVEELRQAGEAVRQSRQASLNLMEEAVTARDRAEAANQELQKEITIRQAHEREIERLNRLYATLSQVNQAIVRTTSRAELLGAICRIAIEYAGYKLAWIGRIDPQTQRVMPLARAGKAADYIDEIKVYADERPEGQGPGGICIREDQPSVFNDFLNAPAGQPWHAAAQAHGLRSLAAFPIRFEGRVWGVLSVYDGEVGIFQDPEIALLVEATKDISFALENLEREAQRQRAEAALRRHQQLLDETQQISRVGGWEYAVATGRITWTAEMFRIHGVADDYNPSPIQKEAIEFYAPADKQRVAAAFQQAHETGEPFDLEMELITPAGTKKWVRTKGQAERVDGKIVRVFGNVMDVTERKVVQERERLARETLELLNKSEGIQDAIPGILSAIKQTTGIEAVAIRLREGEDFPYSVTQGFPEKFVMLERFLCARDPAGAITRDAQGLPVLECMCGNILRGRTNPALPFFTEGGSFWSNGTSELLRTTTEADRQAHTRNRCNSWGYESVALIPLRAGSDIVGLLQFNDHRSNQFTLQLIRFLEGLGASIGIALSRERAQAALRASEASLIHAQQIARLGNWDWNIATDELYWSAQVFALFGISETEADCTYERFLHGVHPEDRERAHQAVQDALAGRAPYNLEHRVLWPDGTVRVMHEQGEVTRDAAGRALHMTGTVQDITERQAAEVALRESEARFRATFEQAAVGVSQVGLDGQWLRVNERLCHLVGYSAEELLRLTFKDITHPDDLAADLKHVRELLAGEIPNYALEKRYVRKDGSEIWINLTVALVRDEAGQPQYFISVIEDISKRKRVEAVVQLHQERLRRTQSVGQVGSWEYSLESGKIWGSDEGFRIFGLPYANEDLAIEIVEACIPERARVHQALRDLIAHGQRYNLEYEVRPANGAAPRIVNAIAELVQDESGKPVKVVGAILDITARKQVETELTETQDRLRLALEAAQLGVFDWQIPKNHIVWSRVHEALWGYAPGEFGGTYESFAARLHPEDLPRVNAKVARCLAEKDRFADEFRVVWPDGSIHWIEAAGEYTFTVTGEPERMRGVVREITAQKQAQEKLRENEARLRAFYDLGLVGLTITSPEKGWLNMNDRLCQMLGYREAELRTMTWAELTHPEDLAADVTQFNRLLAGAIEGYEMEKRFLTRTGTVMPTNLVVRCVRKPDRSLDYVVAMVEDISERKQAEASLRESEERFRRAVVDSPFPILLHAEDGAIIQTSNSWCDITGYNREELRTIGDWTERAYGERKQRVQSEIEALYGMKEFKQEGDYSIRTKSGETRIWGFSSGPLGRLPDGRRLVMSIAMDVTERRQAETEVKTLNAELEQRVRDRTQQLEAANKELEAFSYSVSHDLRTPLRAIDGYGRMLVEDYAGCLDVEGRRLLGVISGETRRMGQLIDDLLAFARLGRKSLEISSLNMTALIQTVFAEQAAQCPERRLQLEMATLPPACGDPAMFGVVWNNLLSNAIKFTRHQERAVIEIGCCPDGEQLVYFVKDNGAGFDMKYADKLFGVFQRLHTAEEFAGTGVGLALVQRVIHRHGGRVWAEAKVNAGATFYFSLPKRKANHDP